MKSLLSRGSKHHLNLPFSPKQSQTSSFSQMPQHKSNQQNCGLILFFRFSLHLIWFQIKKTISGDFSQTKAFKALTASAFPAPWLFQDNNLMAKQDWKRNLRTSKQLKVSSPHQALLFLLANPIALYRKPK